MTATFDIFRVETGGSVLWLESAISLEDAKARARKFAARSPGEYLILNRESGNKLVLQLGARDKAQSGDWNLVSESDLQ